MRKCIAKYHSCNALFTLVLGTAQCKAASKLVCHLVAMSLLWVTNNFFSPPKLLSQLHMFLLFAVVFTGTVPFCTGGEVSRDKGEVTLLCLL